MANTKENKDNKETFNFGKHIGENIADVVVNNPAYVFSLLKNTEEKFKHTVSHEKQLDHFINGKQKMPFGKYKGQVINSIEDENYLEWLLNNLAKNKNEGWLAYKLSYLLGKDLFEF